MTQALEIGKRLAELCVKGEHMQAIEELYADDAKHVEAAAMGPDMPQVTQGKQAILERAAWWTEHMEMHDGDQKGPYPHGEDRFALWMMMDVTPKAGPMQGVRHKEDEVCLYTVKDGKITLVEFFWDPSDMG